VKWLLEALYMQIRRMDRRYAIQWRENVVCYRSVEIRELPIVLLKWRRNVATTYQSHEERKRNLSLNQIFFKES